MMIRPIRSLVLALAAALAACEPLPTENVTPVPGEASVQRQVWEQQGIDDYRYTFGRNCFCVGLPLVRVEVRDGRITDMREAENGRLVARERWTEIPTVDRLFDQIAQTAARNEYVSVSYHPTLGYPMQARLGTMIDDSGVVYSLSNLRPMDRE